jgi:hypothetical protein
MFDMMFDHLESSVRYHSDILLDVMGKAKDTFAVPIELKSRDIQDERSQIAPRNWEDNHGVRFRFQPDGMEEDSNAEETSDVLSAQEEEAFVQEVCSEIQYLFANSTVPQTPLKNLLKKVYRILRHSRQRPALKGLLRQIVHNDKQLFKRAWTSLLYLTRIFLAATTLVQFATKSSFKSIKFQPIPAVVACMPTEPSRRGLTGVLASLGISSPPEDWKDFFLNSNRIDQFAQLSRKQKKVHAEVQLILYAEKRMHTGERLSGRLFPYIGCSKKCCFFCELFCESYRAFQVRGTHKTLFPMWALPRAFPQQSLHVLREFSKLLKDLLSRILTGPHPVLQGDLRQQSSAALSTSKAVQMEVSTFSSRPQILRYVCFWKHLAFNTKAL